MVFPACSPAEPAQRVFNVETMFPTAVLCNETGQGVLRQRVRNAINGLNRDWNFCSFSVEDTRECKELTINVKCDHLRADRQVRSATHEDDAGTYMVSTSVPVEKLVMNTQTRTSIHQ